MKVYQIRMKIFLLEDIVINKIQEKITAFIDSGFKTDEKWLNFHEQNSYKNYCYDQLYPIEKDRVYKKGKIYILTIRTVNLELAKYFKLVCVDNHTKEIKGLVAEIRVLPKKILETVYTLTPMIIKTENGYWKETISFAEFEQRLKVNLIKKWNAYHQEKIDEDFDLYTVIELKNKKPIAMEYKNIKLLGDKVQIQVADNKRAQDLWYFALGVGLGEMNARGCGFLNYRWL